MSGRKKVLFAGRAKRIVLTALSLLSVVTLTGCAQNGPIGLETGSLGTSSAKTATATAPQRTANITSPRQKTPSKQAVADARAAYHKAPKSATAALRYARALRLTGRKKRALQVLSKTAKHHPKHKQIAKIRGLLSLELGRITDAERLLLAAQDPAKPDWRIHSGLGSSLASRGKQKEAQQQFARALELKPGNPSVLNNLALSYALDGNAKQAEGLLRKAALARPQSKRVQQNLALLTSLQSEPSSASNSVASRKTEGWAVAGKKAAKRAPKAKKTIKRVRRITTPGAEKTQKLAARK